MSLTAFLVPTLTHHLTALSGWLDKAEAHVGQQGGSLDDLLGSRLAPDMFPLATQLRFAAFQAQEPLLRLRGEPVPEELNAVRLEGLACAEQPGTLAAGRARIAEALARLGQVGPEEFDSAANREIALDLPMGMVFDMTGLNYVRDWALPQIGFHVDMTYALLRAAGVPLGKADYVPHMFAYLRPGTMPGA
jgi:hypothetical protein